MIGHGGPLDHEPSSEVNVEAQARPGGLESLAESDNAFALAVYGQLRSRPGNLFFSPFSIRTALAMTWAGAGGETAVQMREALRLAPSDETVHADFAERMRRLAAAGGGETEVVVANSVWGQEGAPLQPVFLDRVTRQYGGGVKLVDFRHAAETARAAINQWVEDRTKQRIRDLIPASGLDDLTRLVLVNAVYFKGMWALRFPEDATRDRPFHLEGGGSVEAPLMHQVEEVRYRQAGGFQAVELDYRGGELSMLVILPDEGRTLPEIEEELTARRLRECVDQMRGRRVDLSLPRFELTWGTVDLRGSLVALGMELPFDEDHADFSAINGRRPPDQEALHLESVFHQAFLEVNEEGSEAAAATAGVLRARGLPEAIPVFRADRPFLFAIRDRSSGTVLFLGRLADPTRER